MASTSIANVYDPDIWVPDIQRESEKANALIQSGIMVRSQRVDSAMNAGGQTINIPHMNPIAGSSEVLTNGGSMTPAVQTAGTVVAPKLMRGKTWSWDDVTDWVKPGEQMVDAAVRGLGEWEAEDDTEILIAILTGIFTTALASTHVQTLAGTITGSTIIDAAAKIGDKRRQLAGLVCHSKVAADLDKADLIAYLRDTDNDLGVSLYMNQFQIIEDDTCPVNAGTPNTYDSFLFAAGSVVYGRQTNIPTNEQIELHRNSLASADLLSARRTITISPQGVSYAGADNPANTVLDDGASWTKVYPDKLIKIVKINTQ